MFDPDRSCLAFPTMVTGVYRPDFVCILSLVLLRLSCGRRA